MGWITPVITWIAGNGIGFSDLNRIEGDLKYLREENKTINGTNTFSGNITQASGVTSLKATTIDGSMTINGADTFTTLSKGIGLFGSTPHAYKIGFDNSGGTKGYIRQNIAALETTTFGHIFSFSNSGSPDVFTDVLSIFGDGTLVANGVNNTVDKYQFSSDINISASIGKARIAGISDVMAIGHYGLAQNLTEMAFQQYLIGTTVVNALMGRSVDINVSNINIASFSGIAVSLLKPVTITGALTVDNTAGITATSNIKLLQDTSITGTLGISEIVTFAKGLNIGGTINPTTAPTESTEPTINGHNATQLIPRGAYYIKCSVTKEATVSNDTATIFLQRNIDGLWTTLVSTTTVNVTSASTSTVLASGVQFSSGTNMRINIQQSGFSPSGFVILSKT
jgi:hypothetical protein